MAETCNRVALSLADLFGTDDAAFEDVVDDRAIRIDHRQKDLRHPAILAELVQLVKDVCKAVVAVRQLPTRDGTYTKTHSHRLRATLSIMGYVKATAVCRSVTE